MIHDKCGLEFREGAKGSCLNCRRIAKLVKKGLSVEEARLVEPRGKKVIKDKDWKKNSQLKYLYGIDLERLNKMRKEANYKCQICGCHESESTGGTLCVDHNHETGEVRGLLCRHCNKSLGGFKDSREILLNAAKYLEDTCRLSHKA